MSALNNVGMVDSKDYTMVTSILREFFTKKGFLEVHPQSRLSILAACEDPKTIAGRWVGRWQLCLKCELC